MASGAKELFERLREKRRAFALGALLAATLCGGALLAASALVTSSVEGLCHDDAGKLPERRCALLPGCSKSAGGGRENAFFSQRVEAAAKLYKEGKVRTIIASGDNHTAGYNETRDMRDALALALAGVPPERIACDFAGFRTLDSVARAKEVFGQSAFIVVSQRFHNERAVFIAKARGIDAVGFDAPEPSAPLTLKTKARELFARARCVLDVYVFDCGPKFLGPAVDVP